MVQLKLASKANQLNLLSAIALIVVKVLAIWAKCYHIITQMTLKLRIVNRT